MSLRCLQYPDVENAFDQPDRVAWLARGTCERRGVLANAVGVVVPTGLGAELAAAVAAGGERRVTST
jgi:hypothetical protein